MSLLQQLPLARAEREARSIDHGPVCGLVVFDDQNDPQWASAYLNGQAPRRIEEVAELQTDLLWITNLTAFDDLVKANPHLRGGAYFGPTIQEIASDLGIPQSGMNAFSDQAGLSLATEFSNALRLAAKAYGGNSPAKWLDSLAQPYLHWELAQAMQDAPAPETALGPHLANVLQDAYQGVSTPEWDSWEPSASTRTVVLRFNRLHYCRQILEMSVPAGRNWVAYEGTVNPNKLPEMLARATFVQATLYPKQGIEDLTDLTVAAVGTTGRKRQQKRTWFSQPELVWLSALVEFRVSEFLIDDTPTRKLPVRAQLPQMLVERPEVALSFAAGLVAHAHWLAVSRGRIGEGAGTPDLWGVWLSAMDRSLMHSVAVRAHAEGLHVVSYGDGCVSLRIRDDQTAVLRNFWDDEGFMYPVATTNELHQ